MRAFAVPKTSQLWLLGVSTLLASTVQAAGFQLLEQSVTGLGRSFAGGSLPADDASAAFYNPADMLLLKSENLLQAGTTYVAVESHLRGSYSFPSATAVDEKSKTESLVPHLHYVHALNDRSRVGLSISAPFGLSTEYNDRWEGRYETISSEIMTTDINPSYAYQISDHWLIGAGLSAQYAEVNLKQAVSGSLFSSSTDATAKVHGEDWGWGYNAGLTWLPNDEQRLSLTYRSKVEHELEGDIEVNGFSAPAASMNGTSKGGGDVTLPETITLNAWQKLDDQMAAMFSLRHTRWSRYETLKMRFDNSVWNSTEVQNWHNTLSASFGVDYQLDPKLKVRSGIGYDESPISSSVHRSPRLPATYNTWFSVGLSWQLSEQFTLDAGYMYVQGKSASMNYSSAFGTMNARMDDAQAHELGLQLQYRF